MGATVISAIAVIRPWPPANTDLFDARREKDSSQRVYIQALQQFWRSCFILRRLTRYDFIRQAPLMGLID